MKSKKDNKARMRALLEKLRKSLKSHRDLRLRLFYRDRQLEKKLAKIT